MEIEGRDFINTPPLKTVRFGGTVANTLAKLQKGDTSDYELIKHQLSDPDIKDAQIINWLQEFRTCVTQLGKDHEQLVNVVLKLPWLGRSQAVVEEYLAFLSNLVSAQTVYLRACLRMVITNFLPKRIRIQEGNVDISDSDDEDENLPRTFDNCHQALQLIARYVPSTSRFLMPILTDKFPFVQKSSRTLECYVHNMLRVSVYIPDLRKDILELIISKMLMLDVSAPRSEIEEVESGAQQDTSGASQDECLFNMDEEEDSPLNSGADGREMVHPVAERLDTMMTVLLAYIKDVSHADGTLDIEKTKALYRDLVSVFDKVVLPTHASCHVQFYMFYLCSFRLVSSHFSLVLKKLKQRNTCIKTFLVFTFQGLAEAFLDHLWKLLQGPNQPSVLRQSAAGYMGSFMARAKFLPVSTVKACLDLLVPWLHLYIDSQDSGSKAFCDINLHGPFYTACQAVFYTLIFKHNAILEGNMKKGLAYLQGLNLERIVMCQLNPLRVCLPAVTNMFAAITRKYQLVLCYTIIERNNRHMLPVVRSSVGGSSVPTNTNPLDSFFPFDPYLLKSSGKLIEPIYQVWEEPSDCMINVPKKEIPKGSMEEEDDFLHGETPHGDSIVGMTPGSYDSHLQSPRSVGSPPISFLQRPF
ncbi:RNA polymerase I-specific transcription initiation factor RRN3 isoform X1 [Danio aesculapii]|uniref:RNA polymerase I-specific transcription initiation factor RRN3 isoform X1 n=1 Tax=Danio aesculapii TaxID=1142201 RepID=UPI0024BF59AE|nr:RNA polymerase I-specific transcription initiation factor RRN3 isoform X1 [Danio aesculapii]XP_056309861.1 RNA polymerase I-specific transcription initiation factor RRN3 isoform X1 [Danio aesculapii]